MLKLVTRAILLIFLCSASVSVRADDPGPVEIPAGDLATALESLARQIGIELVYRTEQLEGLTTRGVSGIFSAEAAVAKLLEGTPLTLSVDASGAMLIAMPQLSDNSARMNYRGAGYRSAAGRTHAARSDAQPGGMGQAKAEGRQQSSAVADRDIEEIVVTGTNIKGVMTASPVRIIEKEQIDRTGVTSVAELLETIPQNFGGDYNEDVSGAVSGFSRFDGGGGSAVNLRGLGSEATLVLLNGRRLASTSRFNFVDVSMIPLSALDRVEILTDGASAIYGSDAVAGVVNFVLARDYEGAETSLQYGTVTDGGADELRVVQTIGEDWNDTNLFGSYQYRERGALEAIDRDFTARTAYEGAVNRDELDTLPSQESHNFLLSGTHDFSERASLHTDLLYGVRRSSYDAVFLPPNDLTPQEVNNESEQTSLSLIGQLPISASWDLEIAGVFGHNKQDGEQHFILLGTGSDFAVENELWSIDSKATGPLFNTPGGAVQLAVGGQYREEDYINVSGSGVNARGHRAISSAFAETVLPIVGPENSVDGIDRLELSLAVRHERYDDFGSSTDPKAGLIWSPTPSLRLRGTWGTSFRAPNLHALDFDPTTRGAFLADFPDPSMPDGMSTALLEYSVQNDQLGPEASTAYTLGFDYQPRTIEGLDINVTFFNVKYEDRISQPTSALLAAFVDRDVFAAVIHENPSVEEVNAFVAQLEMVNNVTGRPFDPAEVEAIFDDRIQNLAATDMRGIDFGGQYIFDTSAGNFGLSLSGSYILEFGNQVTPSSDVDDTINTFLNPIDLRFRGSLTWSDGGWLVGGYVNYQDSYYNELFNPAFRIESWVTTDLTMSYEFSESDSALSGIKLSFNARNIFDRDPPAIGEPADLIGFGLALPVEYDPANASPLGRFVSAQITKVW